MYYLSKRKHRKLTRILTYRCKNLIEALESQEVSSDNGGKWDTPATMCVAKGTKFDILLAVKDLETILHEIKKFKK